jgi:hypothetical protein
VKRKIAACLIAFALIGFVLFLTNRGGGATVIKIDQPFIVVSNEFAISIERSPAHLPPTALPEFRVFVTNYSHERLLLDIEPESANSRTSYDLDIDPARKTSPSIMAWDTSFRGSSNLIRIRCSQDLSPIKTAIENFCIGGEDKEIFTRKTWELSLSLPPPVKKR